MEKAISSKSRLAALLFCLLLGFLGVHRFYAGKSGTGVLMIVTFGGCGIWYLIDLVLIGTGSFRDKEGKLIQHWIEKPLM